MICIKLQMHDQQSVYKSCILMIQFFKLSMFHGHYVNMLIKILETHSFYVNENH